MEIYIKLALKYLKRNKKRTIFAVIGIIIVTTLLTSILFLLNIYQDYKISEERYSSNWEARFENIPYKKVYGLKENSDIKQIAVTQGQGISNEDYAEGKEIGNHHIILKAYDEIALKSLGIQMIEGRLPKNEGEIVVSKNFVQDISQITITINNKAKNYQVVGKLEPPSFEEISFQYSKIGAITYLNEDLESNEKVDANIIYKNMNNTYMRTEEIANVLKLYENETQKSQNIKYNENLLHYSNVWNMNSKEDLKMLGVIGIIIFLIIVVSITFLYSIFHLSIEERRKEFANLNSIGATKSQIKSIIFLEATILLIISISIGILLSILLIKGIIYQVNLLSKTNIPLKFSIPYAKLGIAILLTMLTTYLSVLKPAEQASKMMIIDNLKGRRVKENIKKKKYNTIEKLLVYRNKELNKGRYFNVMISITISIFLFIFTQGYIVNNFKNVVDSKYNCDIDITKREYFDVVKEAVKNTKGTSNMLGYAINNCFVTLEENKINESLKQVMEEYPMAFRGLAKNEFLCYIFTLEEENENKYLKQIGQDRLEDGECILINYTNQEIKNFKGMYMTNYKEGDEITLYLYSKNDKTTATNMNELIEKIQTEPLEIGEDNQKKTKIKVAKVVNDELQIPVYGMETTISFIVNENTLNSILYELLPGAIKDENTLEKINFSLLVHTNNKQNLENTLEKIRSKNRLGTNYINVRYIDENTELNQKQFTQIFLYSLTILVVCVTLSNIINVLFNDMRIRSKDFSVLASIGMEKSQFRKIIFREYSSYFVSSFILGVSLGIFSNYMIFLLNRQYIYYLFKIPYLEIGIIILILGLLLWYMTRSIDKRINQNNIVEIIKNEDK